MPNFGNSKQITGIAVAVIHAVGYEEELENRNSNH